MLLGRIVPWKRNTPAKEKVGGLENDKTVPLVTWAVMRKILRHRRSYCGLKKWTNS